jgi:hypothetical protein
VCFWLISTLIICVIDFCFIAAPEQQKRQINSLPVKQKKKKIAPYIWLTFVAIATESS